METAAYLYAPGLSPTYEFVPRRLALRQDYAATATFRVPAVALIFGTNTRIAGTILHSRMTGGFAHPPNGRSYLGSLYNN